MYNHLINVIFLISFLLTDQVLTGQSNASFDKIYQQVDNNIHNDLPEKNILLIDSLESASYINMLDCQQKGKLYHLLGVSYYVMDQEAKAIEIFKDLVLTIWKDCEAVLPSEMANTMFNIGMSYQYTEESHLAGEYLEKAILIFENDPEYSQLYLAQNYLGTGAYYNSLHDFVRADVYFQNALNIYTILPDTDVEELDILNRLIILNNEFEKYQDAYRYFNESLELLNNSSESIPYEDLAITYLNGASVLIGLQQYTEAKPIVKKALGFISKSESPELYSNGLETLGVIHQKTNDLTSAKKNYEDVIAMRRQYPNDIYSIQSKSIAYENMSELYLAYSSFEKATSYIDTALSILCSTTTFDSSRNPVIKGNIINNEIDLLRILALKASIKKDQFQQNDQVNELQHAEDIYRKIDTIIYNSLGTYQSELSKLEIYDLIVEYYGEGIATSLQLFDQTNDKRHLRHAYYLSSKSKALILQTQINQDNAFEDIVSLEVISQEERLSRELNDIKDQLKYGDDEIRDSLTRAFSKKQLQRNLFMRDVERNYPEYYEQKHNFGSVPSEYDLQQSLSEDQIVIEYFYDKRTIYSFWVTKNNFFHLTTPNDENWKLQYTHFISYIQDANAKDIHEISTELYNLLIQPGLVKLKDKYSSMYIIPDGRLHDIPFEALRITNGSLSRYLIEDFCVITSYSSRFLLESQNRSNNKQSYVGFGTNYNDHLNKDLAKKGQTFEGLNLSTFQLAEEEINQGAKIFNGVSYTAADANITNFLQSTTDANIIHLSLHGVVNENDLSDSYLIFDNRNDNFILTALDLYAHGLSADLVILSACHSASGKIYNGEGVQGMSRAFKRAGASQIISSLWSASERSSNYILTNFLRSYHQGIPTNDALRAAKLNYINESIPSQRHPYYWANYILIGSLSTASSSYHTLWIIAAFLSIVLSLYFYKRTFQSSDI